MQYCCTRAGFRKAGSGASQCTIRQDTTGRLRSLAQRKRNVEIAYTGRGRSEIAYVDNIETLAGPHARVNCKDVGGMLDVKALLARQPANTSAYACGAAGLIGAVHVAATALGWAGTHSVFIRELFTPPPSSDEVAFEVVLKESGQTVRVGADICADQITLE